MCMDLDDCVYGVEGEACKNMLCIWTALEQYGATNIDEDEEGQS